MRRVATVLVSVVIGLGFVVACSGDGDPDASQVATGDIDRGSTTSIPGRVDAVDLAGRSVRGFSPAVDAPRRVGVVVTFGADSIAEVWVQKAEGDTASSEWTVSGAFTAVRSDDAITLSIADPCLTSVLPEPIECEPVPPFTLQLRGEAEFTAVALSSAHPNSLPPPFDELDGWLDVHEDESFD